MAASIKVLRLKHQLDHGDVKMYLLNTAVYLKMAQWIIS